MQTLIVCMVQLSNGNPAMLCDMNENAEHAQFHFKPNNKLTLFLTLTVVDKIYNSASATLCHHRWKENCGVPLLLTFTGRMSLQNTFMITFNEITNDMK